MMASDIVTLNLHYHGTYMGSGPNLRYENGEDGFVDIDPDRFSFFELEGIAAEPRFNIKKVKKMYFSVPGLPLNEGLRVIYDDQSARAMGQYLVNYGSVDWYLEHEIEEAVIAPKLLTGPEQTPVADEAAVAEVEEVRVQEDLDTEDQVHGLLNEEVVVNGLGFEEVVIESAPVEIEVEIRDDFDHPYFKEANDDTEHVDEETTGARNNFRFVLGEAMGGVEIPVEEVGVGFDQDFGEHDDDDGYTSDYWNDEELGDVVQNEEDMYDDATRSTVVATRVASSSVVDLSTKKVAQGKGKKKQPWKPPSISFSDNDGRMYGMIGGGRTSPLSKSKETNFRTGKKFVPSTSIGASFGQGTSNSQPSGPNYRPSKKRMEGLGICPKTGRFITSLDRPKPQVGKSQKRARTHVEDSIHEGASSMTDLGPKEGM
ncbi:hypothetical protein CCACVL1_02695 [Corchorus capsularis]|uniref:PB1-like domain-containing protein n=1 Tax=Corchorus capsularis TaxID=210143 RepID=A0A1R3K6T4_COCAP|nr:hypothetical protein CCACVL1_02695 [Corchorus capsularis]